MDDTLPLGALLRDYSVLEVLSREHFGVVYRALDLHLCREVTIKEYLPEGLAVRLEHQQVAVMPGGHAARYHSGLAAFLHEAQLSARFNHFALPHVHAYWEGNGTAYMAMPHYPGTTLAQALEAARHPPDEAWLRALISPLLGALSVLHAKRCYHRNISPQNIWVLPSGEPLLLDFGAATQVASERTVPLVTLLNPLYAPIEQYSEATELPQGPWTDLYALAGVMHHAITGQPPVPATVRAVDDTQRPLRLDFQTRSNASPQPIYSPSFLASIDQALAVRPQDRPQSAEEFQKNWDAPAASAVSAALPQAPSLMDWPLTAEDHNVAAAKKTTPNQRLPGVAPTSLWVSATTRKWPTVASVAVMLLVLASLIGFWWARGAPTQTQLPRASQTSNSTVNPVLIDDVNAHAASAPVTGSPPVDSGSLPAQSTASQTPEQKLSPEQDRVNQNTEAAVNAANTALASATAQSKIRDLSNRDITTPRTVCGARTNFSLLYCMEKQCAQSKFSKHPQCLSLKASGEVQ